MSERPTVAARWMHDAPIESMADTLAPNAISLAATSTLPLIIASWRGVKPPSSLLREETKKPYRSVSSLDH